LDARDFFAHQVGPMEELPASQLRFTTMFIGIGRIPKDIMGIPMEQFGATHPRGDANTDPTTDSTMTNDDDLFRPAKFVSHKNTSISDDLSALTMPLIEKFPKATMGALIAHSNLEYDEIRIGSKGACLNYNIFGVCHNKTCTYRHSQANPTAERIKTVTDKLKPAIRSFMSAGAPPRPHNDRKRRHPNA
jgi:hypothetical protein